MAAAALVVGGLATSIGSFLTWGACPLEPCGGDFRITVIYERSGVQFGPGMVTAILGALLALLGFIASRKVDRMVSLIGIVAAGGALITIGIHLLMVYGNEGDIVTGLPYLGLYITAIGAILSPWPRARGCGSFSGANREPGKPARRVTTDAHVVLDGCHYHQIVSQRRELLMPITRPQSAHIGVVLMRGVPLARAPGRPTGTRGLKPSERPTCRQLQCAPIPRLERWVPRVAAVRGPPDRPPTGCTPSRCRSGPARS